MDAINKELDEVAKAAPSTLSLVGKIKAMLKDEISKIAKYYPVNRNIECRKMRVKNSQARSKI